MESFWVEESGRSIKDILQESISFLLSEGESIDDITTAGRTEHQWSMQAETEYIVYAFTVTGTGLINSDVHTETVVTNIPAPSENILTITVSNIGPDYAMAFGYKSGGATTSLVKFVFRTATAQ